MEESDFPIFQFDNDINFWLVRANGGKYFDDFINNDYIGIEYNQVRINDLQNLPLISVESIRDIIFNKYNKNKNLTENNLNSTSKSQLTIHAKQTYLFTFGMGTGDLVITPAKKSYNFALGVIVSDAFDENIKLVSQRNRETKRKDVQYTTSNYVKRRRVKWISIIERKDIPNELSWIMNAHQAIAQLNLEDKSKIFNLISPIFKYENNYYLHVYTSKGGELRVKDWNVLISKLPEDAQKNINLRANVNSPGFLTFIASNFKYIQLIFNNILPKGSEYWAIVMILSVYALIGKDNLSKKGIISWTQDIYRKHLDNKLHNLKVKKEINEMKRRQDDKNNFELKKTGKPVIKNDSKIVGLPLDKKKDSKNNSDSRK